MKPTNPLYNFKLRLHHRSIPADGGDEVTVRRLDVNPKSSGFARIFLAMRFLADNAVFCLVKSIVLQNKRIWRRPFPLK